MWKLLPRGKSVATRWGSIGRSIDTVGLPDLLEKCCAKLASCKLLSLVVIMLRGNCHHVATFISTWKSWKFNSEILPKTLVHYPVISECILIRILPRNKSVVPGRRKLGLVNLVGLFLFIYHNGKNSHCG